jgi:hypothetical protein
MSGRIASTKSLFKINLMFLNVEDYVKMSTFVFNAQQF